MMPLPFKLGPELSMNRIRLVDLHGIALPSDAKGKTGYELVSSVVLTQFIRRHIKQLVLVDNGDDHELRMSYLRCLAHVDPQIRDCAHLVAEQFGRNLGYLLLVLKRGDAVNRDARPEWQAVHWDYWGKINAVWLGGGLVTGYFGEVMRGSAERIMREAGFDEYAMQVSEYGSELPLIGVARSLSGSESCTLVLDFGGTMIKRAIARYSSGDLTALRVLTPIPTQWEQFVREIANPVERAHRFLEHVVRIIVDSLREITHRCLTVEIGMSIAAYIADGHPLRTQSGLYLEVSRAVDNLQSYLSKRVGDELGQLAPITLLHDGTAAALCYAGVEESAVITVGTAMGIGFPPDETGLCSISPDLEIIRF